MDLICRDPDFFKNPNKLPLNQLNLLYKTAINPEKQFTLKKYKNVEEANEDCKKHFDIKKEMIPALDRIWIKQAPTFPRFQRFRFELPEEDNNLFIRDNKEFQQFIKYALEITFQQFWCFVSFDKDFRDNLMDFLRDAIRPYARKFLSGRNLDVYNQIYLDTCLVFERMIEFNVSEEQYIQPDVAIQLMKKSKILNLQIIIDLCGLYSQTRSDVMIDFIANYRTSCNEEEYFKEFSDILESILEQLEKIVEKVEQQYYIETKHNIDPYSTIDITFIYDIVHPLLRSLHALYSFLSLTKEVYRIAFDVNFPEQLANCYLELFTPLSQLYTICKRDKNITVLTGPEYNKVTGMFMALCRKQMIDIFHLFICDCIDNVLHFSSNADKQREYLDKILQLMVEVMDYDGFIYDYNQTHPVDEQFRMLEDAAPQIDKTVPNYILEVITPILIDYEQQHINKIEQKVEFNHHIEKTIEPQPSTSSRSSPKFTPEEIDQKIQFVQDVLPELGDGFIYKCLEVMNFDEEWVLASILDNNLNPELKQLERDLIRIPPDVKVELVTPGTVDNEIPQDGVAVAYFGKKPQHLDTKELLDDKQELKYLKNTVIERYNYELDDDEYDDSWLEARWPKMNKNVRQQYPNHYEDDEEDEEEEETGDDDNAQNNLQPPPLYEDPAVIRARYEANRKNRGHISKKPQPTGAGDVVGKPKGQGQDKNVQISRQKKTVNKSSKGNHNRKGQAQWKYSKGMY